MGWVLNACGNDLSRENIMKQALNMHEVRCPILLPGMTLTTSSTHYRPRFGDLPKRAEWVSDVYAHVFFVGAVSAGNRDCFGPLRENAASR